MSVRALAVGIATLVCAVPAMAQQRGTMEFGAFGSAATFDNALSLTNGYGAGGRIGMYLEHRWAVEFEKGEMLVSRPDGLKDVNMGILSSRLMYFPHIQGRLSFHLGVGAGVSTETNFLHSYGVDAMGGAAYAINEKASLRVDGVWDWLANYDRRQYKTIHVGLSFFRRPASGVPYPSTFSTAPAAPATVAAADTVASAKP